MIRRRLAASSLVVAVALLSPTVGAQAQVDPTPTATPSAEPTVDPSPTPTPNPSPTPTPHPSPSPSPPGDSGSTWPPPPPGQGGNGVAVDGTAPPHGPGPDGSPSPDPDAPQDPGLVVSGPLSTAALDTVAERRRRDGWSAERIRREIYRPFIVVGPATWVDSWHAARYGGGFHLHEGQDVMCRYGAQVLAAATGTLEFGTNSLGGNAAYIRFAGGGFLYYAHLAGWNRELEGSVVHPGDLIGWCGTSGNATTPHIHFGWYDADGLAHNPMGLLAGWLRAAETRVLGAPAVPAALPATAGPLIVDLSDEYGMAPPPDDAPAPVPATPVEVIQVAPAVATEGAGPPGAGGLGNVLMLALAGLLPGLALVAGSRQRICGRDRDRLRLLREVATPTPTPILRPDLEEPETGLTAMARRYQRLRRQNPEP